MFKKLSKNLLIFFISLILLVSCTSHIKLTPENRKKIKTISIDENIKKPKQIIDENSASAMGLLVKTIVASIENRPMTIEKFVEKNNIDIRKIVYQKWVNKLSQQQVKLNSQHGDAKLTTEILNYGITSHFNFSTEYVPCLVLNAKLVQNNKTIWQYGSWVIWPAANGMPRYKIEQIFQDPKYLHEMWDKAADKIITALIDDMNK